MRQNSKKIPLSGSSTTKIVKTTRPKSKLTQMRSLSPFPTGSSTSFVPG